MIGRLLFVLGETKEQPLGVMKMSSPLRHHLQIKLSILLVPVILSMRHSSTVKSERLIGKRDSNLHVLSLAARLARKDSMEFQNSKIKPWFAYLKLQQQFLLEVIVEKTSGEH
jgi:hypothetical protein